MNRQALRLAICRPLGNEDGFVLIAAIMVLLLLVILGISALTTTNIELQISGNEKAYIQNFYRAESSVQEAAQRLYNASSEWLKSRTLSGFNLESALGDATDITNASNWTPTLSQTGAMNGTSYIMVDKGITGGGSLDMAASQLHSVYVTGRAIDPVSGSTSFITIGYKRRF